MSLIKYSYPIVFGTFLVAVSTTFIFRYLDVQRSQRDLLFVTFNCREKLLPADLQMESNKFYHSEDKAGRQLLAEAIKARNG